jgi:hypothetical protein
MRRRTNNVQAAIHRGLIKNRIPDISAITAICEDEVLLSRVDDYKRLAADLQ